LAGYLAGDADPATPSRFRLVGVVVHSGTSRSGHYFACLWTMESGQWYKFNDSSVSAISEDEAITANFGAASAVDPITGAAASPTPSAYMLVYVRVDELADIYEDVPDTLIPAQALELIDTDPSHHSFSIVTDDFIRDRAGHGDFTLRFDRMDFSSLRTVTVRTTDFWQSLYANITGGGLDLADGFPVFALSASGASQVVGPPDKTLEAYGDAPAIYILDRNSPAPSFLLFCFAYFPTLTVRVQYIAAYAVDLTATLRSLAQTVVADLETDSELIATWRMAASGPEELDLDRQHGSVAYPSGSSIIFEFDSRMRGPAGPDTVMSFLSSCETVLGCAEYLNYWLDEVEVDAVCEGGHQRVRIPREVTHDELLAWLVRAVFGRGEDISGFEIFFDHALRCASPHDLVCGSRVELVRVDCVASGLLRGALRILYFFSDDTFRVGAMNTALFPESATVAELLWRARRHFGAVPLRVFRCTGKGKIRRLLADTDLLGVGKCFRIEAIPKAQAAAGRLQLMPTAYDEDEIHVSFVLLLVAAESFETTKERIMEQLAPWLGADNGEEFTYWYKGKSDRSQTKLHNIDCLHTIFAEKGGEATVVVRKWKAPSRELRPRRPPGASVRICH
jgi:hypothetical protein